MSLELKFENIQPYNGYPTIKIILNGNVIYDDVVIENIKLVETFKEINTLDIVHYGKTANDTLLENQTITKDKNFTLKDIIIDDYSIEELIWESSFTCEDSTVIPGCLFFGPNGTYSIAFESPILKWILKTRHTKNNNDPNWQEDYNYFMRAAQLIKDLK